MDSMILWDRRRTDARYDLDDQTAFKAQFINEHDSINDHFYQKSAVGLE